MKTMKMTNPFQRFNQNIIPQAVRRILGNKYATPSEVASILNLDKPGYHFIESQGLWDKIKDRNSLLYMLSGFMPEIENFSYRNSVLEFTETIRLEINKDKFLSINTVFENIYNDIILIEKENSNYFIFMQIFNVGELTQKSSDLIEQGLMVIVSQIEGDKNPPHLLTNQAENIYQKILYKHPEILLKKSSWMMFSKELNGTYSLSNFGFDASGTAQYSGPIIPIDELKSNSKLFFDLFHPGYFTIENIIEYKKNKQVLKKEFKYNNFENISRVLESINNIMNGHHRHGDVSVTLNEQSLLERLLEKTIIEYKFFKSKMHEEFIKADSFPANRTELSSTELSLTLEELVSITQIRNLELIEYEDFLKENFKIYDVDTVKQSIREYLN